MLSTPQNTRVLIIDDNPILVNVFVKMLQIKGFFAVGETSLKAGLQRMESESYCAVFVDAPLGNYDKKQILALLKENQVFQKTAVFLFSGVDFDSTELDKWKKYGLYSYLKKPVKRSVILKALNDVRMNENFANFQTASDLVIKPSSKIVLVN